MSWFLVGYFVVFVGAAMGLRSWLVWRQTGVNPVVLHSPDPAHRYLALTFVVLMAGIGAALVAAALDRAELLGPLPLPKGHTMLGAVTLALALVLVMVAQAQMGASWRIGVDTHTETALVKKGLFRYCRNPIFLGMQLSLLGLFVSLPTWFTLFAVVLGHVVIQLQVRLEEAHLLARHDGAYRQYMAQVPRWVGLAPRGL